MKSFMCMGSLLRLVICSSLVFLLSIMLSYAATAATDLQGLKLENGYNNKHSQSTYTGPTSQYGDCGWGGENPYEYVASSSDLTLSTIYEPNSSTYCHDGVSTRSFVGYGWEWITGHPPATCITCRRSDNRPPSHLCTTSNSSTIVFSAGNKTLEGIGSGDESELARYNNIKEICSSAPPPSAHSTSSEEASSSYTFKIDCEGGKKAESITVLGKEYSKNDDMMINGVSQTCQEGWGRCQNWWSSWEWKVPVNAKCGELVTLTPAVTGNNIFTTTMTLIRANMVCTLKINDFSSSNTSINPNSGEKVQLLGTLSDESDWSLTIGGRGFSGTGSSVSVAWDGKDNYGKTLPTGSYEAKLTISTRDKECNDNKTIFITVQSCSLKSSEFKGSSQTISPESGGDIKLSGNIFDDSGKNVNWQIAVAGKSYQGSGKDPVAIWDGMDSNGKVVEQGSYSATLTAQTDGGQCTASETIDFTVVPAPDGQCGLLVQFGSSAHVANGALTHSQELFTAKGGNLSAGVTLRYNSRDGYAGALGTGWSHSYDFFLKQTSTGSVLIHEGSGQRKLYKLLNGVYVSQPGDYSILTKKADGSFTLTKKDGTINTFAADGKLTSIADRNGNILNLTYADGKLAIVADPAGRVITFTYDAASHLTKVTDPSGSNYNLSVGNFLNTVTQPDGSVWQYSYDANAYMLTKTDPLGNVTSYAYDDRHRVVSSIDPEGRTRSITYPQTSNTVKSTTFTEKDGGVWQYSYDTQKGTLISKTDPQGGVTSYSYDAADNRISTTNPDGTTTTSTYDSAGNMLTITDALEQTTSYSYNAFGQVTGSTDSQGGITTYVYDAKGNMTSLADPTGAATTYTYDANGNITKMTNAAGQATTFAYDAQGNLASVIDPAGAVTTYAYDAAGNMISITDTKGAITQFVYDNRNRLIKTIDPQGNATLYSYDANGNKLSETDANGNTTTFEYNSKNQLIKTTDALGNVTTYVYNGSACPSCGVGSGEKLTSLADANNNITSYSYDQLGRLMKETDPLGNITSYAYDVRGNLTSKTDANGNTINYIYDANGRLLKKVYPDATEETLTYDPKGNILSATNMHISYSFSYDATGRMQSSTDSNGKFVQYSYYDDGRRTKTIYPEGSVVSYAYDKAGRLATITNGGGKTYAFAYDQLGRRSSLSFPNGAKVTYSYDTAGRLTNLAHKSSSGTTIASFNYTLDKAGNRLTKATPYAATSYQYDAVYRLTQALSSSPGYSGTTTGKGGGIPNAVQQQKEFFSYDPVGNRLASDKTTTYLYNQGNQLILNGGSYLYDKNGNLIQKTTSTGITTYVWDYENRLIGVTTPVIKAEYAYDPLGRRIQKKVTEVGTTTTSNYFYDGQNIILEYDGSGSIANKYVHGPNIDEPLAITTGKETYFYHADGLGSVVALTDQSGRIEQSYEYGSFGNLMDQKNKIKQPFTYTGREWDKETVLNYYRARYYDSMEGRFISKDPVGFKGGINVYAYVSNNVINDTDPTGLFPGPCGNESHQWVPDRPWWYCDFSGPCQGHDDCYGCEGKRQGKTKSQCDRDFLNGMLASCNKYSGKANSTCVVASYLYYTAVSTGGGKDFDNARECCK